MNLQLYGFGSVFFSGGYIDFRRRTHVSFGFVSVSVKCLEWSCYWHMLFRGFEVVPIYCDILL